MKKQFTLLVATFCLVFGALAQFEGVIEFEKKVGTVVVNYKYYIKGDNIRVEEIGDESSIDGIELINTKNNTIYALSPERKMYMEVPTGRPAQTAKTTVEKTKSTKKINNETCTKWVVKCPDQDRVVTYWMAKGDYNFFIPMLKTLNRKEKLAVYYLQLQGTDGFFPMVGEETKIDGTPIGSLNVKSIERKTMESSLFEIPKGYTKFERDK
ncbi:MAG: DUF4412 domain-containing protein [Flavobacteriales bacterium]